mgnify:CR=1 FL=1
MNLMSEDSYYVGAYWGNREESAERCAARLGRWLSALAGFDPAFRRWFRKARSRREALKHEVLVDPIGLVDLIRGGRTKDDTGGEIPELGFGVSFWNGESGDRSAGMSIRCGGYASSEQAWLPNACIVDLPSRGDGPTQAMTGTALVELMRILGDCWDPDWASAVSRLYQQLRPVPPIGAPEVGWATYFSERRGPIPVLPPLAKSTPLSAGTVVILTEEPFTTTNPVHLSVASEVEEGLRRAGLLDTTGPGPIRVRS